MLSPLELLDCAQKLAARIPPTLEYADERNAAWMAVGFARLKFDNMANAQWALERLDDLCTQARLRLEIGKWAGDHPGSEIGRNILRETIEQFSAFEHCLSRKPISDLVPAVFKVLGAEGVYSLARQLEDPFTAGNVCVMLSYQLPDASARREPLRHAEKLATTVRAGNRDYALRWVFSGYRAAGLMDDAERIRRLASIDPEELRRNESALFAGANNVLFDADQLLSKGPQDPPDSPLDRLRRLLDYRFNDLKVTFLVELCRAGGMADPEVEELIRSESFQRIEPPRAPPIGSDTSSMDAATMARFLFGRPVFRHANDRVLLEGEDYRDYDIEATVFVGQMSGVFLDFGRLAEPFSPEQIERGLWFVLGNPFWLGSLLYERHVPPDLREECLRSMFYPFRDYYLARGEHFSGSIFYMWWDMLLGYGNQKQRSEAETTVIDVLRQILQLPSMECQFAALHGLNHMHPSPEAAASVRRYLEERRAFLTAAEICWVESCAIGAAQ